jgi:hypothetical protein
MRTGLTCFAFVLVGFLPAIAQQPSTEAAAPVAFFAFWPAIGQSRRYQYSDTSTTSKRNQGFAATLTLTSVSTKEMRATITVNGGAERSLNFYVDDGGTLQPMSMLETNSKSPNKRRSQDQSEQAVALQALVSRISLASRIGAQPTQETSFQAKINVPEASCPLNPTLVLKPTEPGSSCRRRERYNFR